MRLGSSLRRRRGEDGARPNRPAGPRPPDHEGWRALVPRLDTRRGRLTAGVLVIVGGWLLGYLGATQILFPAPAPPGAMVQVPDVRGLTAADAMAAVVAAELEPGRVESVRHPVVDSGRVVGQSPLPGQLARPGSPIRLTLSLGSERRQIPAVTGLPADRAMAMLQAMGLEVTADSVEVAAARGRIVAISPDEGADISLPGSVRVTVSLGPPTVLMPSVLGLDEGAARDSLTAMGLEVGEVEEVFRFGRDQGRVVRQEPAAGVELERGAAVRLMVGRRGG